jgi:hypothetical protein
MSQPTSERNLLFGILAFTASNPEGSLRNSRT